MHFQRRLLLCDGVHFLEKTLLLQGGVHDGLLIQSVPRQMAFISGGQPLTSIKFKKTQRNTVKNDGTVTSTDMYVAHVPPTATRGIKRITSLNTLEPHTRLVRARFPFVNPELSVRGWLNATAVLHWQRPPHSFGAGQFTVTKNLSDCHQFTPCKNDSAFPPYNTYTRGFNGHCRKWTPPESYW